MVGVSAVTPEEGAEVVLPPGPRAVLVYVKKLDQAFLDTVAEPLPVTDLKLALPEAAASAATLPLIAPDGARLGSLTWQPHQPGWEFLRSVFPSLAIAFAVIALFTMLVLRHARVAAETIQASEVRFRDVADASSDWIWETDPDLRLKFLSERFATVTGISPNLVLGKPLGDLLHSAETAERWERYQSDLLQRRPFRNPLCLCEDDAGRARTLRVAGQAGRRREGGHRGWRGTATDITAEIEAERRAQYLALHDPLTELPNRDLFRDRLAQTLEQAKRNDWTLGILYIDLDGFKDVNDTFGHGTGDKLLARSRSD